MNIRIPILATLAYLLPLSTHAAAPGDPGEFSFRRTVPLATEQTERLRELVKNDEEAAALFKELEAEAKPLIGIEPNPIAKIHYEGLVNTNPKRIKSVKHLRQMEDASILFQYWQASGNEEAAETLRNMVTAWATTYVPTGNDVNENKFYPLYTAYEALRPTFSEEERGQVDAWIRKIGKLHEKEVKNPTFMTNRFTKSIRMLAMFARILDEPAWDKMAKDGFKTYVTESLRPDGTSLDLERRDTLTYHTSGLRPIVEIAIYAGDEGRELYEWESPVKSSLKKSVDYVVPFANGTKTRKEWLNTTVDLDRRRGAAGIEAYRPGRLYEPENSLTLFEEASFFDPSFMPLVNKFAGSDAKRFATWTMVVNAAANHSP